jgi:hypothetical protein
MINRNDEEGEIETCEEEEPERLRKKWTAEEAAANPSEVLRKSCPHCGQLVDQTSFFCLHCGERVFSDSGFLGMLLVRFIKGRAGIFLVLIIGLILIIGLLLF